MKTDAHMNALLARYSGKGKQHYRHLRDAHKSMGGEGFGALLIAYAQRWPDRVVIHRPYNISASPMIEVLPNG